MFVTGPEGSGKSTLSRAVDIEGQPVSIVSFSQELKRFIEAKKEDDQWKIAVRRAEKALAKRSKDLSPRLVKEVFRQALQAIPSDRRSLIVFEGFLRKDYQCAETPQLVADILPHHVLMCVEAVCPADIAHARALNRGLQTDTQELIAQCHQEYFAQLPLIRDLCKQWAHYVEVPTVHTEEKTRDAFKAELDNLLATLQEDPSDVVSKRASVLLHLTDEADTSIVA
jgi:adenylate kinase family enzyme